MADKSVRPRPRYLSYPSNDHYDLRKPSQNSSNSNSSDSYNFNSKNKHATSGFPAFGAPSTGARVKSQPDVAIQILTEDPFAVGAVGGNNTNKASNTNGNESPESGSLYSDEIPSGYNSGEQYDTISTGYMSGEAYELPETRMDLREPALDVIEECHQPQSNDKNDSEDMFKVPVVTVATPTASVKLQEMQMHQDEDVSSTSSGADNMRPNEDMDSILNTSPTAYGKKMRKNVSTVHKMRSV